MASLQIRNLDDELFAMLKILAVASGKRGVETYVRDLLAAHIQKPPKRFLSNIEERHAAMQRRYGRLSTTSEDRIREDRDA